MSNLLTQTMSKGVSENYKVITSEQVINRFTSKGYEVTQFQKARVKNQDSEGFQKHLIRVTHSDFATALKDARPEIVIVNSYNGSTALSMFLGAYRFVCANGLMVGAGFGGASIRHVGSNIDEKIDKGIEGLVTEMPKMISNIETMSSKIPSVSAVKEFTSQAYGLVIPDGAVIPDSSLGVSVSRIEDTKRDAYTVFNVIQETVLRRGVNYFSEDNKHRRTRTVKSITRQVSLNRDLWDLANEILVA